jgi:lipopolysaccharide export system protein LptA
LGVAGLRGQVSSKKAGLCLVFIWAVRPLGACAGYNYPLFNSKIRAFMNYSSSLLLTLALLTAFPAMAEKADRNMPMNAESDSLRYDDINQSSIFSGNVIITKGTILIRGARVDVTQDAQGYQQAVILAEPGKLAYYRSKRDGVDEVIEGQGERIQYDSQADTVKFIGKAVLRRYVDGKLADESIGALIRYENTTDVFTVDGSAQPVRTASNPSGRVRTVLAPRAPAAPVGVAPVKPAQDIPTPRLRPSTTLGIEKK